MVVGSRPREAASVPLACRDSSRRAALICVMKSPSRFVFGAVCPGGFPAIRCPQFIQLAELGQSVHDVSGRRRYSLQRYRLPGFGFYPSWQLMEARRARLLTLCRCWRQERRSCQCGSRSQQLFSRGSRTPRRLPSSGVPSACARGSDQHARGQRRRHCSVCRHRTSPVGTRLRNRCALCSSGRRTRRGQFFGDQDEEPHARS